jgi:hypothetical protein
MVLTLHSSTAGMFKLPIFSPLKALAASSQMRNAGNTNCSHRTNLSVNHQSVYACRFKRHYKPTV